MSDIPDTLSEAYDACARKMRAVILAGGLAISAVAGGTVLSKDANSDVLSPQSVRGEFTKVVETADPQKTSIPKALEREAAQLKIEIGEDGVATFSKRNPGRVHRSKFLALG
jgi:hypothetical protein